MSTSEDSEKMKRRNQDFFDYIRQPVKTPNRASNAFGPNQNDKRKLLRSIFIIILLIFFAAFIHIIYRLQQPQNTIIQTTNSLNADETVKIKESKSLTSVDEALQFTNEDCANKMDCGRCWLYENLNMLLEISSIIPIPNNELDEYHQNLKLTAYRITLKDINPSTTCNAKDITIYISINDENNESVGGLAVVDESSPCGWKYKWTISKAGIYTINAYLLYYRGYLDFDESKCKNEKNIQYIDKSEDGSYTLAKLPEKWRFYGQVEGCCEWCNRMNGKCQSWSSGGGGSNKCVLFTHSPNGNGGQIESMKHNGWISGLYRNEPQQWYLGSLLNIQPNECHNTRLDLIYGSGETYEITGLEIKFEEENENLCQSTKEMGRWVSVKNYDCASSKDFDSWCWIKQHFAQVPYRWSAYSCSFERKSVKKINECLVKKDVHRIAVGGDSLIRLFSLELVRYVFGEPLLRGNNWRKWGYSKHYNWTNGEAQVWFMGYDHKIDDITFMKEFIMSKDNENKPNVFIHNFQVIHKIWHQNVTQFEKTMHDYKESANELFAEYYGEQSDGNWPIRMVFESPLLVSEREYHDTADRAIIYNDIMREILEADGWIFIPVMELSKARMYDSTNKKDGVVDGMHMSSNILIEIARVVVDMLCRFDFKEHRPSNKLNPLYTSVT